MLLPDDVRERIRKEEWEHRSFFPAHLLGDRQGCRFNLGSPSGRQATADPTKLREFREAWEQVEQQFQGVEPPVVDFKVRKLQVFGEQRLPESANFPSLPVVAQFLGAAAVRRLELLDSRLDPFRRVDSALGRAAARRAARIEEMSSGEAAMLARAIPQMRQGMGENTFLRSLPLEGVDTKFVERNHQTILLILDEWKDGAVVESGGLEAWLGCLTKGEDRLLVRPLCPATRAAFRNGRKMWMTSDDLVALDMPGYRLLIVENETPAFELPEIEGCVAVASCGGNLGWMTAPWLDGREIAYWGDIDSWGFRLLSIARGHRPALRPLLMDHATWDKHPAIVVTEKLAVREIPQHLTAAEQALFVLLRDHANAPARMEQEKLDREWVVAALQAWAQS